jgi:hypothetical protein
VSTVGIKAENIKNSIQTNRHPALFRTLVASLPIPKYSRPIKMPIHRWDINLSLVNVWNKRNTCFIYDKKRYILIFLHDYFSYLCSFPLSRLYQITSQNVNIFVVISLRDSKNYYKFTSYYKFNWNTTSWPFLSNLNPFLWPFMLNFE